jgi:RNA polymerase sigma-70 factor (ECF subfamily)
MEYEDTLHPVLEKEKLLERMELAIEGLNDDQKKCVTLFYLEKKSYQEIMEMTGFNFMQVKSFIQNGKRNLKLKIAEQEND